MPCHARTFRHSGASSVAQLVRHDKHRPRLGPEAGLQPLCGWSWLRPRLSLPVSISTAYGRAVAQRDA